MSARVEELLAENTRLREQLAHYQENDLPLSICCNAPLMSFVSMHTEMCTDCRTETKIKK